jgi:hypothetical protein
MTYLCPSRVSRSFALVHWLCSAGSSLSHDAGPASDPRSVRSS